MSPMSSFTLLSLSRIVSLLQHRTKSFKMVKDLFIIDTRCHLNRSIAKAFEKKGYEVKVRLQVGKDE